MKNIVDITPRTLACLSGCVCALLLALAACSSPTEIDTHRDRYFEDEPVEPETRFTASAVQLTMQDLGNPDITYNCDNLSVEIDTAGGKTLLWLTGECLATPAALPEFFYMERFILRQEGIELGTAPLELIHDLSIEGRELEIVVTTPSFGAFSFFPDGRTENLFQLKRISLNDNGELVIGVNTVVKPLGRAIQLEGELLVQY